MKGFVALVLLLHGLIHAMGIARGLGLREPLDPKRPVSPLATIGWVLALVLLVAAAGLRGLDHAVWWWVAGLGVLVSQVVIFTAWSDARYGTLVNAVLVLPVVHAGLSLGPGSYHAHYEAVARELAAEPVSADVVTEAELATLPPAAARYLRASGAIGRPRVTWFAATWRGRIRGGPDAPWMALEARQVNHTRAPSRHFLMNARVSGVPAQGLHAYADGEAWMQVDVLSVVPVAEASGPEMTRAETVTLLNDMAILAPSALLQPDVRFEPVDDDRFRLVYTTGPITVSATVLVDATGALVDFVSDDRGFLRDDGTIEPMRWSTPVRSPRRFDGWRVPSEGQGVWHPQGEAPFVYLELKLETLTLDGRRVASVERPSG